MPLFLCEYLLVTILVKLKSNAKNMVIMIIIIRDKLNFNILL